MNQEISEKNKKENCSFCDSTKEAVNKLDTAKGVKAKHKGNLSARWLTFLFLIVGVLAIWKLQLSFSSSSKRQVSLSPDSKGIEIGSFAPDFASEDVFSTKVSLSDFQDKKPVLLIFWATWCGQCAKELPSLKTFTKRYQDKIQVLVVDSGETKQTIKDYIQEKNTNFLILLDEERKIWNQYLIRGTPSHFLIDKEGKIVTLRPGLAGLSDLETMLTMVK